MIASKINANKFEQVEKKVLGEYDIVLGSDVSVSEAFSRKAKAQKRAKVALATAATHGILTGAIIAIVAMRGE